MSPRLRNLLTHLGSFALAGILMYFALRGVDLDVVGAALTTADYRWLLPLVAVVILSHVMRAWRWQVMLEALPQKAKATTAPPVTLRLSFFSVMIGYMVNYAAPRLGELARTGNMATRAKLPFTSVFGTVVADRVLDMLLLALALATLPFVLLNQTDDLNRLFLDPLAAQIERVPLLALFGLAVLGLVLVFLSVRWVRRAETSRVARLWRDRVEPLLAAFRDGLLTVLRTPRRGVLVVSTVVMWGSYLMMAYLPFVILGMAGPYELSLLDTWAIMLLGALGIVVPSPGGVGSYHYITIQTLVYLFAVDAEPAATYAVLAHATQLVLYVALGALALVLQGSSLKALRRQTAAAKESTPSP